MVKTTEKRNNPSPKSSQGLWFFILAASLLLNAYYFVYKKDKSNQVLASVPGENFRWRDVSDQRQKALLQIDGAYYNLLKSEASLWAEKVVLPKEADARGISVTELVKLEINDKVIKPTSEDTAAVYAKSPSADTKPYPQVLKEIESELYSKRYAETKKQFLERLFAKYNVVFKIKAPRGYQEPKAVVSQFPYYEAPPAGMGLDANKNVVGSPSRGNSQAPIVIEVYSDFMCPFSKKFNVALDEVQKKYPEKIRVVFRHFPLTFHQGAEVMAQASACAQEQGKFWEYHDKLMVAGGKLEKEALIKLSSELGLEATPFQTCLESGKYKEWVESDMNAGKSAGVTGTPGFFVNGRRSSGAVPVETLSTYIDWYLNPKGQYPGFQNKPLPGLGNPAAENKPQGPELDTAKVYDLPQEWLKKGIARGPQNAPITIVEMMDYNCPFCKKGSEVMDQLVAKNPGKIKIIAKNFPLPMHANAAKTSEALLCANEQGKFTEFRALMNGEFWGKFTPEDMKAIARKSQLKEAEFNACFDGSKMKAIIDEDVKIAQGFGVRGTPTFFVNGTPVVGAQPVENFQKMVDEKLSGKKT